MSAITAELPYLLLGSSQRAALQAALVGRLTDWRRQWSTAVGAITVNVPETLASGWAQFTQGHGTLLSSGVDDTTLLHAQVTSGFLPALLGLDCRASEVASHDLGGQLRLEVLRSLCGALLQGVSADARFEADAATQAARLDSARKHRALPVRAAFATTSPCTLILHPRLIEVLAPRRHASSSKQLERRQAAIAPQGLRVEAVLGEVELPFGELRSLSRGDVIVLGKSLSDPVRLVTEAGAAVAAVGIGSAGAKRAVRVVS